MTATFIDFTLKWTPLKYPLAQPLTPSVTPAVFVERYGVPFHLLWYLHCGDDDL